MANNKNPIGSVGGTAVPSPGSFQWEKEDLSDSSAGRTEDGLMHKKRIGSKVAISLSWQNITTSAASQILSAFDSEYISVSYLDPEIGSMTTKTFYVGNRTAPMYNAALIICLNSIITMNGLRFLMRMQSLISLIWLISSYSRWN